MYTRAAFEPREYNRQDWRTLAKNTSVVIYSQCSGSNFSVLQ